jgi:hypothetical protein
MKGSRYARNNGKVITAKEIADAAGINTITLFYNAKMLKEIIKSL